MPCLDWGLSLYYLASPSITPERGGFAVNIVINVAMTFLGVGRRRRDALWDGHNFPWDSNLTFWPQSFLWSWHSLTGGIWALRRAFRLFFVDTLSLCWFLELPPAVSIVYVTAGTIASIPPSLKYFYVVSSLLWFASTSHKYPFSGPSLEALIVLHQVEWVRVSADPGHATKDGLTEPWVLVS